MTNFRFASLLLPAALLAIPTGAAGQAGKAPKTVALCLPPGSPKPEPCATSRAGQVIRLQVATTRDPEIQLWARQSRARVLVALEDRDAAIEALIEIWKEYGHLQAGIDAGFQAAKMLEAKTKDRWRALELYQELAAHAGSLEDVRTAREAIARLERRAG